MNPEFLRNLWLELTPHRLIGFPVVFALIFTLLLALNDYHLTKDGAFWSLVLFALFSGAWGVKKATGAVYEEVVGNTWDWQRMSGLTPWAMTWGKLFGSTLFAWYAGVLFLLVAAAALLMNAGSAREWQWFLLVLLGVLFAQASGLMLNLLYIRSRPLGHSRSGSSLYLLVLVGIGMSGWGLDQVGRDQVLWYGYEVSLMHYVLSGTLLAWLWAVVGAYRVMRREFLYTASPWVWSAFLLCLAGFFAGLETQSLAVRVTVAFALWWCATMVTLFLEPKDPVQLRALFKALREGAMGSLLQQIPSWLVALALALLALLVLPLVSPGMYVWRDQGLVPSVTLSLVLMLFLLRDVAIFLWLALTRRHPRPEATAFFYLVVLYVLIPWLLAVMKLEGLSSWFVPRPDQPFLLAVVPPTLMLLLAGGLLYRQWRRLE